MSNRQRIVSITFDDCCSSVASAGGALFKRLGVAGTFFVCGKYVEMKSRPPAGCTCKKPCVCAVTVEQLQTLKRDGWEIASHTWSHSKLVRNVSAELEILGNICWLNGYGFDAGGLSYPWGVCDENALRLATKYHKYARATSKTAGPDRYRLGATVLSEKTSIEAAVALVHANCSSGKDTFFFGHRIGNERDGYSWSINNLEMLILASIDAGARVAPLREVF